MLIMSCHRSKARAEVARVRSVRLQAWFDHLIAEKERLTEPFFPPADQLYSVIHEGRRWLVIVEDPTQP